ncbi:MULTISPECIES: SDR family NAD(P)-dependent oxidoreductase [unclassified Polaromonas]|jgi:NAD(P)-dependent dehydrogenase (short-subunit alcohol dehydrogenase family)|uniref:SDR family NAD(P)-dependent oxidoreductase n=1 Tax=unclassified Polaromonas TaxID=2638319 RepID=UPI000BD7E54B|nr:MULTISPECIES: SDR family NAD(P)-dependent oxidoreductase [unclassified Polaromonas]OYY38497.1 MAG: short-chain dehydrogenase [Polaromonas sp. 35-63-35]OYZ21345.1 MAG: short-chain dehydrogenase [Polaromonas sp. 16-63-31]OYZ79099.1 MAG: short-chain dehydrogenase [Polaromonas sp. 24-63-21]OZA50235.1 MAG: short-chain dehydrogenase [Polaromonas sp. 17-63-33]OZA89267.1 MAG: short-chain dehydrogenase [Polaromonas sp. 39-63-25]
MPYNPPLRDWHGKTVWLVGASSGIGHATAHALHEAGAKVVVSARNGAALEAFVAAHPGAQALMLDASDAAAVKTAAQSLLAQGPLDLMMYCAGYYREQRATGFDLADMLRHQQVNYVGALYVLDAVLPAMLQRGSGHLSLVGSVAGYRGLPQSLAYGPTKAALINLAETLYLDLQASGVGVSLVNPGFVETPLTAGNQFSMPALISPAQAATEILAGWARGEFEIHFPKRFTLWMKTLRVLPYALYFPAIRKFTGL